jgi:hypothetical protein
MYFLLKAHQDWESKTAAKRLKVDQLPAAAKERFFFLKTPALSKVHPSSCTPPPITGFPQIFLLLKRLTWFSWISQPMTFKNLRMNL